MPVGVRRGERAPLLLVTVFQASPSEVGWALAIYNTVAAGPHAGIDRAYHAKYDRYGPAIVGSVVGDKSVAVTIRLVPTS